MSRKPRNTGLEDNGGFMRKTSDVPNERWSMRGLIKRIKAKKKSNLDDRLVIGIDFGTTYSGVAWATVDDLEDGEINIITSWPGSRREDGKAPTELFYEYDKVMWGYEVPSDADPALWFKLLLLKEEDLDESLRQSDYYIRAKRKLTELEKPPTEIIADYLRALWKHTLDTIHKSRSKFVIAALAFHVVLTVPAIWKDYARTSMQEAVARAGILDHRPAGPTTLSFVPEPEAAGLVTLCEHGEMLKTDDVYVICDAGGGTVDLISYRIGELNPIQLHEAVVGTGGLCGGIFIDEQFERLCKQRLGRNWNNLSQSGIKAMMKGEWEYVYKPSYTGRDVDREFPIGIPDEALRGSGMNDTKRKPHIKNGRIHFSNENIREVFMSAFSSIEVLIDGQVKKAGEKSLSVQGIVLVGGLGASPYLYNHLKARYEGKGIQILQAAGMRPRTAICRGAILKGFLDIPSTVGGASSHVSVVSTIARRNLGISSNSAFITGVHDPRDRIWDGDEAIWRAKGQMQWYLRKGQSVSTEEPIRHEFYRTFATAKAFEDNGSTFIDKILQCEDDMPPSRKTEKVSILCEISWNHGGEITFDSLDDFPGAKSNCLKILGYEIVMVPSGASTEFAIYYKKMKVASHNVHVRFSQ
ncbi:actin-like ATPase domain-containing protein [Xylaria bambusicola]|uniref:actin-like ATPase domain-containing protein n=1 Tax=Xylaria bambusicola TaxID=326684 RepID=UPI00200885D8|nr:actin-like ATPase domain-containing protein [Xylaria bambusicola]KAI0521984.1 actin-like ATPase domain-containing protein [Xylaria bambusicola]